jgi:hypothetical protein
MEVLNLDFKTNCNQEQYEQRTGEHSYSKTKQSYSNAIACFRIFIKIKISKLVCLIPKNNLKGPIEQLLIERLKPLGKRA